MCLRRLQRLDDLRLVLLLLLLLLLLVLLLLLLQAALEALRAEADSKKPRSSSSRRGSVRVSTGRAGALGGACTSRACVTPPLYERAPSARRSCGLRACVRAQSASGAEVDGDVLAALARQAAELEALRQDGVTRSKRAREMVAEKDKEIGGAFGGCTASSSHTHVAHLRPSL